MNLRDLGYLVALADLRHFGKAAEACFVSQPTLSTQVRKLEEELGVTLVERAPRKVMLTVAGQDVVARARRILADVEQMKESARRSQNPESGTLRLGVFPTLGPYLLPHVLPQLQVRFPKLELLLVEEKSDVLLARLREGKLDAALLAAPAQHPLASKTSMTMAELANETLLLLEDGHCLRDQALDVCKLSGANEKTGFRATSLETLRQMVAAGVGVTLLPALSVHAPVVQPANIRLVRFQDPVPSRQIALVWRRSSALDRFLRSLADTLGMLARARLSQP